MNQLNQLPQAVDLRLDFPEDRDVYRQVIISYCSDKKYGYQSWRMKQHCNNIGLDHNEVLNLYRTQGEDAVGDLVEKATISHGVKTFDEYVDEFDAYMDDAGVEYGCLAAYNRSNETIAQLLERGKLKRNRITPIYYATNCDIMGGVTDFEHYVKEYGFGALYVSQLRVGKPADDSKLYPLYAKACELNIPVFSYCCMNFSTGYPMEATHPYHVDNVASDFPDMKLCVATTGWPWVGEYMALAMRHKNVYLNTECYEANYFTRPGFGFEPFMEFLKNGRIADKLCFASMGIGQALPLKRLVQEVRDLPLDDDIKCKILRDNPNRFLGRE